MGLGRTLPFCESGSTIELGDFPIMVRVRGKKNYQQLIYFCRVQLHLHIFTPKVDQGWLVSSSVRFIAGPIGPLDAHFGG